MCRACLKVKSGEADLPQLGRSLAQHRAPCEGSLVLRPLSCLTRRSDDAVRQPTEREGLKVSAAGAC